MTSIDARDLFGSRAFEDPYSLYETMRTLAPVCAIGETGAYFVGTHAAVEEAVRRHDAFSANLKRMLICGDDEKPYVLDLGSASTASDVIATADEPDHAIHRRLMLPPLKASHIARLEQELRAFARERVIAFLRAGGGDICAVLAEPLPAYVVMRLLDLDDDALPLVRRWAMMGGDFLAGRLSASQLERVLAETSAQHEYLSKHFDAVRARTLDRRGSSLTATLADGVERGAITRAQAIGISVVLFGAAGESTAALLGSAVRLIAANPLLQEHLRAAPGLIAPFIEEAVRLETPFKFHYRVVRQASQLCGAELHPGALLLLGWSSANRDPAIWDDPNTLKLDRPLANRHLGFGYGIHYCIGAPLARLEVTVALQELLSQTKTIAIDQAHPPVYAPSIFVRRLLNLHLTAR